MKYILKEYISLLKEDQELDTLITDLLFSLNIIPISKPQRGRQYGVDIAGIGIDDDGKKKLFLIAVKQGNITRNVWDSGTTAVRQTLNDILDVYITAVLTKSQRNLPIKIIVCTNGEMEQTVLLNWNKFTDNTSNKREVEFDFWGIDKIASLVDKHLMIEQLFDSSMKVQLKKTLAFIDLPDYDLNHYYDLIRQLYLVNTSQKKKVERILKMARLCFSIIIKWSKDSNNLKPAIIASEKTLLLTYNWLKNNDLLYQQYAIKEFYSFHNLKIEIGREYIANTKDHFLVKNSLFRYSKNEIEYSLSVWEQLGIVSSIALTEIAEAAIVLGSDPDYAGVCYENARQQIILLQYIIQNNPPSSYPEYDEHLIEITLVMIAFSKAGFVNFASQWLSSIIVGLNDRFGLKKFIPQFHKDYQKLANIYLGNDVSIINSSMLITILADWCVIFEAPVLYKLLCEVVNQNYPELDLQLWVAASNSEDFLYTENMSRESGHTKCSIQLHEQMEVYRQEMIDDCEHSKEEREFSLMKNHFYYLGYLSSRHYRSNLLPLYWRSLVSPKQQ